MMLSACLFLILGIDDLLIDGLWIVQERRDRSITTPTVPNMRFAVVVPAWREAAVIGDMLRRVLTLWSGADIRIYCAVYPNDPPTLRAVRAVAARNSRLRLVLNPKPGPTTKGDGLNRAWAAIEADAKSGAFVAEALILHDAEDWVDPHELAVFAEGLSTADYVQIPVVPLVNGGCDWIGGHYLDEFACLHARDMVVRDALGAPLPTAGVGCAFRMDGLRRICGSGGPFESASLTEDYELGVRLSALGYRGRFLRYRADGGRLIASRGYFPDEFRDSVRQKARWIRGIAFDAWDRLGWPKRQPSGVVHAVSAIWMMWRDRRSIFAAVAVVCGYGAAVGMMLAWLFGIHRAPTPALDTLIGINLLLLVWRMMMRAWATGRLGGWRQALLSIPRMIVSNAVLVVATGMALRSYWAGRRGQTLRWDKTVHRFPSATLEERGGG